LIAQSSIFTYFCSAPFILWSLHSYLYFLFQDDGLAVFESVTLYGSDLTLFANEDQALDVDADNVDIFLYGFNTMKLAEVPDPGIAFNSPGGSLNVLGTLDVELHGGEGIVLIEGTLNLEECSFLRSCNNNIGSSPPDLGLDIVADGGALGTNMGTVVCNVVDPNAQALGIECASGCNPVNVATICEGKDVF